MDGFTGFYGPPYARSDPHHTLEGYTQDETMGGIDPSALDASALGQAQTLHQIINQNNEELMRRRNNYPAQYRHGSHDHGRRASMLEFSSNVDGDLADFQFDPNPNEATLAMAPSNIMSVQKGLDPRKVRSREDLALNTRFSQMNTNFDAMQAVTNFSPLVISSTSIPTESSTAYMPPEMDMSMDFDPVPGSTNAPSVQDALYTASPIEQAYQMPYPIGGHDTSRGSMSPQVQSRMGTLVPGMSSIAESFLKSQQLGRPTPAASVSITPNSTSAMASPAHVQHTPSRRMSADLQNRYAGAGIEHPGSFLFAH